MFNAADTKIAFIGLGVMGSRIARNLINAKFELTLFDVLANATASFRDLPCKIAGSAAEAANEADIVITVLPDGPHVKEALLGDRGVVTTLKRGGLILDMSTTTAKASDETAAAVEEMGYRFVDSALGRMPRDAEMGTLLIIAGGSPEDIVTAKPIFECIGNQIVHAGPRGSGIRLKLINNYMSTVGALLTAEALTLANKVGLDRGITVEVLSSTTAGRGQLIVNYPRKVLAGDIEADFPLRMAQKDVSNALALGADTGVPMMLGAITREAFSLAKPWHRENDDWTAMLLLLEDITQTPHLPAVQRKI